MGNKNHFESLKRRINPRELSPYLHIDPQTKEYVPRWGGMSLEFGTRLGKEGSRTTYSVDDVFTFSLLPPVQGIPAPEYLAERRAAIVINSIFDSEILARLKKEHDIIACRHGTNWGLLPEQILAANLQERGIEVLTYQGNPVLPKVGGRNRIQTHGILLAR